MRDKSTPSILERMQKTLKIGLILIVLLNLLELLAGLYLLERINESVSILLSNG